MIAGIDVGRRVSLVVLKGRKVVYVGDLEECELDFEFAGIDAPLSFPESGCFRECERKLQRMGIKLLPPKFIERVALKGMEIAGKLRRMGVEVYEVYPYATRCILNIAPKANKKTEKGRREILRDLRKFLEFDVLKDHDSIDAAISALTVLFYVEGLGEIVEGRDGKILIPKPSPSRLP